MSFLLASVKIILFSIANLVIFCYYYIWENHNAVLANNIVREIEDSKERNEMV